MNDFSWTFDDESGLSYQRRLDSGAFGDVHEGMLPISQVLKLSAAPEERHWKGTTLRFSGFWLANRYLQENSSGFGASLNTVDIQNEIRAVEKSCSPSTIHENIVAVLRARITPKFRSICSIWRCAILTLEQYIPLLWEPTISFANGRSRHFGF